MLHEGDVPRFDPQTWDFRVTGLVEIPLRLTWNQFTRVPMKEVVVDMHCVTRWSRFDVRWEGVPFLIRAGKCLPVTTTEVLVTLKRPPLSHLAPGAGNHVRFRLSPEVEIALGSRVRRPGAAFVT